MDFLLPTEDTESRGNTLYTSLLQLSMSFVSSVVLIGLPRGNNRTR